MTRGTYWISEADRQCCNAIAGVVDRPPARAGGGVHHRAAGEVGARVRARQIERAVVSHAAQRAAVANEVSARELRRADDSVRLGRE